MGTERLARRLGTGDAVVVGLSAMIGAGVFAAFAPAAAAGGSAVFVALGIAAVIAFCNAAASAQLATHHTSSGGTYLFGREVLGPWWGFVAGWGFVVGKTASCAAMALTFAAYAVPGGGWQQKPAAALAVGLLTVATLRGITRTARLARLLLAVTVLVLLLALVVAGAGEPSGHDRLPAPGGVTDVLQAAGLLFFAFAGYARIATLAEEVRRPRVLGQAILVALGIVVVLYLVVGVVLVHALGADLPTSTAPLSDAVAAAGAGWAAPVVRVGAAAACLGALLALLAGVTRTSLAMARERDLPTSLAHVHPTHRVPDVAQVTLGIAVVALVLSINLRGAIGFSSFGVLVYYAVANLSALRQPAEQRVWPRGLQLLGLTGCLVLAATLPWQAVISGLGVFAVGIAGRMALRSRR